METEKKTRIGSVSVILTTYNEGFLLADSVAKLRAALQQLPGEFEIIIADDGSTDDSVALAADLARQDGSIKCTARSHNCGRGQTVEDGIRIASGDVVGFIDTDLEIPPENIEKMLEPIINGYDITIGNRFRLGNFRYTYRWMISMVYANLMRFILGIPFEDTEAGIKFFRRERILPLLDQTENKGWPWDTEIIVKAHYNQLRIIEVPITLKKNPTIPSTVNIIATIIEYLKNLRYLLRYIRARKKIIQNQQG